jgi:hypothetical protein
MKNENIFFLIAAILTLTAAGMRYFELPFAAEAGIVTKTLFIAAFLYLVFTKAKLKKKVSQLEGEQQ